MYFRILNDEASGELTYLLADLDAREAVLIDPRGQDLPILAAMLAERELNLRWVLRTHQHDHLKPKELALLGRFGVPLVQGDAQVGAHCVAHGDVLPFGHELVRVLSTPGHTHACLSFAWRDRLFLGGLLEVETCPYEPHPAAPEALWDSVNQRVFSLPNETLLFSGHEQRARSVSTVQEQRRWHPLFARLNRDEFLAYVAALPNLPTRAATVEADHKKLN
jgi:glyoxylase-like metal-dependent hydrolase (beta-lactamase superfamily II)